MKIKILFLVLMAMMSIIFGGCNEQSANPANDNKIVIGIDEEFPPFGFKADNGDILGFDVELAKETMRRMGREVEFKPIDWDNKENELNSRNIDMIWNGLEITDECRQEMLFSNPYMYSGFIVFVRHSNNSEQINSKNKLSGLIVGIQSGSSAEMYINNDNELKTNIKGLELYRDNKIMFEDLINGKIDAVIADETNGRYYILKNYLEDKIDALNIPIGDKGKIAIGFRKKDINLLKDVQRAFDEIIKDGTAGNISKRWFGKDLIIHN